MRWLNAALLACVAACSAPATPPELLRAERLEHEGHDEEGATAYRTATDLCDKKPRPIVKAAWCRAALFGLARTLERLGRLEEAIQVYLSIPARVPSLRDAAAGSLEAAGRIDLALHRDTQAYELLWKVITDYPDESAADDALRHILDDGRHRNPRQLYDALLGLYGALSATAIGDNLLWDLASLAREDLGQPAAARQLLDQLADAYPKSGYFDDALWLGAKLAEEAGDWAGAVRRCRKLVATRTWAFLVGSYNTPFLDDAQLELGLILRDHLGRPRDALEELARLEADYPTSVLRDDALYEIAVTRDALGERTEACRALADLRRRFPDSKHELSQAPTLRGKLGCEVR